MVRSSGILLHPTALPGSPVCGTFGEPSRNWLKKLASSGIGVWQFLPLSPSDSSGSPYSSPSSFALNPFLLDVEDLIEDGFLPKSVLNDSPGAAEVNNSKVDFNLAESRSERIGYLLRVNWSGQKKEKKNEFDNWTKKQFWLDDFIIFMQLRRQFQGRPWWEWPENLSCRRSRQIRRWKAQNKNKLLEHALIQWHLYRQLKAIKKLAKSLGIILFGDLPFYVARDSADVWSNRLLFSILKGGGLLKQSGVPPDYFSSTGQLWGTPIYQWWMHRITRFRWWRKRFIHQINNVDLLRLDHFRALESYWSVPGEDATAENGSWKQSPGHSLLTHFRSDLNGRLPIIAEDLGVITKAVEDLRDSFSLPGMKILQFAFDGDENNLYLPENIKDTNCIAYTGTHDNPTSIEWWDHADEFTRNEVFKRSVADFDSPSWHLIDLGLSCKAKLFITPLQDLLCLGSEARFNKPGTSSGNWDWRITASNYSLEYSLHHYGQRSLFWGRTFEAASSIVC